MIIRKSGKRVYESKWLQVDEDQVEFSNGHQGIYSVVHKNNFSVVIAFKDNKFVMVGQYRYTIQKDSLEFPMGAHQNDPNIDPLKLAADELEEETGLIATDLELIGEVNTAPGFTEQVFSIFLATSFKPGKIHRDVTESDMEMVTLSKEDLEHKLNTGEITDGPTIASWAKLRLVKSVWYERL